MSEQMSLPTSRGSLASEWAELSPHQRERVAILFLGLRELLPEASQSDACRLWEPLVDAVRDTAAAAPSPEGRDGLARIANSGSDPKGVSFIAHMDSIAREAVVERLLPEGSRVYGCIATIQGRRPVSSPVSPPREGSEVVADRLDACFRDQALSGQGWDGLQQMWRAAERHISDAEDL